MQKIKLSQPAKTPHFIGSWVIEGNPICAELIDYFETHPSRQKGGAVGSQVESKTFLKDSVDMSIRPKEIDQLGLEPLWLYFNELFRCYQDYAEQWPYLKTIAGRIEIGQFNLQRYLKGQHFGALHAERTGIDTLHRYFAFMTYLNDVEIEHGGSTYFEHFDLEIQPKKGLTLIWPADWTHLHRGNILNSGKKYIITGWLHIPAD